MAAIGWLLYTREEGTKRSEGAQFVLPTLRSAQIVSTPMPAATTDPPCAAAGIPTVPLQRANEASTPPPTAAPATAPTPPPDNPTLAPTGQPQQGQEATGTAADTSGY